MFAVPMPDPRHARITVEFVKQRPENSQLMTVAEVKMEDCRIVLTRAEFEAKKSVFNLNRLQRGNQDHVWLCPSSLENIELVGELGDTEFDYIKIALKGCDQDDCASGAELISTSLALSHIEEYPDLLQSQ